MPPVRRKPLDPRRAFSMNLHPQLPPEVVIAPTDLRKSERRQLVLNAAESWIARGQN